MFGLSSPPAIIRPFAQKDARACYAVFRDAVLWGTAPHYALDEREAWAGPAHMPADWTARLDEQITWVAQGSRARIEGFLTVGHDGHIDFFYIAPARRGTGLAARLYEQAEAHCRAQGLTIMTTAASHLARAFLTRRGWQTEARQSVIRASVAITNFRMSKTI
ncbi:GNAT family N-acetyltransferase [Aliiroseovarius sp. PTFE2010]|uniref:GNAT family N-acetyltransferase n=1 Tax=Aliiroseovarius sp. PTFE2010 TaxID=3417190 RepID=UPI003CF154DC